PTFGGAPSARAPPARCDGACPPSLAISFGCNLISGDWEEASMRKRKRIGVLTGGGDAPGLNPAIRSVVHRAADADLDVIGIHDGWEGLLDEHVDEIWPLDIATVRTWDRDGGTHLGSSRTNPYKAAKRGVAHRDQGEKHTDRSAEVLRNIAE